MMHYDSHCIDLFTIGCALSTISIASVAIVLSSLVFISYLQINTWLFPSHHLSHLGCSTLITETLKH